MWEELLNALKGLGTGALNAVGGGQNATTLALLTTLMSALQNQMNKQGTSLGDATGKTQSLINNATQQQNAAALPADTINTMRGALTNRAYTSPVQPTVTAPTSMPGRYNPYGGQGTMGNAIDPTLISRMTQLATGSNPNTAWVDGALQQQLRNRAGQRGMRQGNMAGTLTPYGG